MILSRDIPKTAQKNVLRGGLDADTCSLERYQPWPIKFYTNVSTNCIFLKSTCNEEGQVIYDKGNRNTDATCRCDYTRGYDFLVKSLNPCFCVPSKEDCSCYLKTCPKSNDKLSPDYKCLHDEENITVYECKPIIYKRVSTAVNQSKTENISTRQSISNKVYFIDEPPSNIYLIEGQTVELKYKLLINRSPSVFLKNDKFLPEMKNIEKAVDGLSKILKITNVTSNDVGGYCLKVADYKSRLTTLYIKPMFTLKIYTHHCTEGNKIELTCSVYTYNIEVKWYKENNELHECKNISITSNGNHRTLIIVETTATDYFVKAKNVEMEMSLTVKGNFIDSVWQHTRFRTVMTNVF
ncbi:TTN [Mytilus coruscus]|uniref:TTN n=1 Tax=Mytilus coruscus TaxID=42192 RepID=A0A6J8DQG0_MYTCO|nr:TTN [Mytilus coruscus]